VFATLFDFDGVLVDSEPVHLAAFNDVLARLNIRLSADEYIDRYLSLDDAGVFREVLNRARVTLDEEQVRALVAAKTPLFLDRFAATFRVFQGPRELVRRRAGRGPVGVVSGALLAEVEVGLSRMGVRDSVAFIIAAADTVMNRPSAALLAEVFPDVRLTREVGEFGTLLAIDRARQVLGFEPRHSWRDHVSPAATAP